MAKTKAQKQSSVEQYKAKIAVSKAILFIRPTGVNANETVEIKKQLRAGKADYNIIKNTLFKRALEEMDMPAVADLEFGVNAVVFCEDDFVSAAKIIKETATKLEDRFVSNVGILEGGLLSKAQVAELADMPSKEVIIAQIAGVLQNPMVGVVNVLEDSVRSLVYILDQAYKA